MRALAACFAVVLGLGSMTALATTMAGCSDTSDAGSGGASGAAMNARAGAGGAACSFQSDACTGCLGTKCTDQVGACSADTACAKGLKALTPCVCGGSTVDECANTFVMDGGDPALLLAQCYTVNCESACN